MAIKWANNATGTLASAITNSATSITLSAGNGALFPTISGSDYFYATLVDSSNNKEIVKVTGVVGNVLTIVRGHDSSTAKSHVAGSKVRHMAIAEDFRNAAPAAATAPAAPAATPAKK